MEKKSPDLPPVFSAPAGMGPSGLIPPSHFETRRRLSVPPPPVVVPPPQPPPLVYEPWADVAGELAELRKENEELKKRWARGDGARARSLDRHQPSAPAAESQALGIISQQMQEIRRLELAVADAHETEEKLARLAQEMQELRRALRDSKQAEDRQRLAGEVAARQHREELLMMSERHTAEAETLRSRLLALEAELKEGREDQQQEVTRLRGDLQAANQARERLAEQLSQSQLELASQNSLVQQLRTYIGELVPDNGKLEEQKRERAELQNTIQALEKERDALQTSVSLVHTRLSSLTTILSLQESELCKKGVHGDAEKTRLLLSRWREKVFSLMVQMKSEEINKENDSRKIREKILSLERSLEESDQKQTLLSHSLQDRTAELEMEKVRNESLQDELRAARTACDLVGRRAEKAEKTSLRLKETVDLFVQAMSAQEETLKAALSRLATLSQRVSFAAKRVDAMQGLVAQRLALEKLSQVEKAKDAAAEPDIRRPSYEDLEVEVKFLHEERDRLSTELKRSALLIEGRVREARERVEAELAESRHAASLLRQSLCETEGKEQELRCQLLETERRRQEAGEDAARLREQLQRQQGEYETELQRKVSDVEEKMTQRLSQMEKHLQEARREHTKAVVALRQAERQMQRDKTRSQETLRTLEDAGRLREEQLSQQLREAERDKNLMIATLRQEGLLTAFQRNRTAAVQPPASQEEGRRAAGASGRSSAPVCKESISTMLANLQSLGNTLLTEEDDDDDDDDDDEEEEIKLNP
ncbi:coiled-coil alpha-helical rod protein 1 [Spea bombifrons]|uniref:coiled-coil alpha-helical rod protein 1 n=1 Tax=Spea bombifrons TaxID=233779 RepID=UPI0023490BFF|nr:coiled-coil alpha-helical rod protein 1 [Spea bombifrons]